VRPGWTTLEGIPSDAEKRMERSPDLPPDAVPLIGQAIENLAAARVGRALFPLGLLFLVGVGEMMAGVRGWVLAGGAPLAAAAMLAHGMRVVQRSVGRPRRPWMILASVGGVVPLALGLYVFGWRGLRGLSTFAGPRGVVEGLFFTLVGLWVLRAWTKLLELASLADAMTNADGTGGDR